MIPLSLFEFILGFISPFEFLFESFRVSRLYLLFLRNKASLWFKIKKKLQEASDYVSKLALGFPEYIMECEITGCSRMIYSESNNLLHLFQ